MQRLRDYFSHNQEEIATGILVNYIQRILDLLTTIILGLAYLIWGVVSKKWDFLGLGARVGIVTTVLIYIIILAIIVIIAHLIFSLLSIQKMIKKRNNKDSKKRNDLQSNKSSDDISLQPLPRENGKYVSVRVHNEDKKKSIYCTVIPKQILFWRDDAIIPAHWEDVSTKLFSGSSPFSWHPNSDSPEKEIKPDTDEITNIAKFESQKDLAGKTTFTFYDSRPNYHSGKYKIYLDFLYRAGENDSSYKTKPFIVCTDTIEANDLAVYYQLDIWECGESDEEPKEPEIIFAPSNEEGEFGDNGDDVYKIARMKIFNNIDTNFTKCYVTLQYADDVFISGEENSRIPLIPSLGDKNQPDRIRWKEEKYMNERCEIEIPTKDARYVDIADTLGTFHYNLCKGEVEARWDVGTPLHIIQLRIDYFNGKEAKYANFEGYIYASNLQYDSKILEQNIKDNIRASKMANQITYLKMIFRKGNWLYDKEIRDCLNIPKNPL